MTAAEHVPVGAGFSRRRRSAAGVALAASALLLSAGGASHAARAGPDQPAVGQAGSSLGAKEDAPSTSRRRRRPLRRRDAPPRGVANTVNQFAVGDPDCSYGYPSRIGALNIEFERGSHYRGDSASLTGRLGESLLLCFDGFDPRRPILAKIHRPNGTSLSRSVRRRNLDPYYHRKTLPSWDFGFLPDDPIGIYTLRASQGLLSLERSFEVGSSFGPLVRALPGRDLAILGSGFEARRVITLHIHSNARYHRRRGSGRVNGPHYVTAVKVRTDAVGGFLYRLATGPQDPPGCYYFTPSITPRYRASSALVCIP